MAEIRWIKLMIDMFDNSKIKYIRTLPEGNNIVLIWIMLLTKAGRCNSNGFVFLTENIPYTPEMLSAEFGFDVNIINLALITLSKLNMIELHEQAIEITGWEEYQNIEGMDKIREQNKLRKQKQREKEKKLLVENVTSRDSHVTVTQQNKNKNKNKKEETTTTSSIENSSSGGGSEILTIAEKHNFILSPIQIEQIMDDVNTYSFEEVSKALEISDNNGKHTYSYVKGVLQKRRADADTRNKEESEIAERIAKGEDPF